MKAERALANPANSCPASSGEDKPMIPKKNYPLIPVEKYEITPVKAYPVTPVKDYPLIPKVEGALTPVKNYPIIPKKDYPVSPVPDAQNYAVIPVKDYPIASIQSSPQSDFLKKLLKTGSASMESGKDSGLTDSAGGSETDSEFHTGCSEDGSSVSEASSEEYQDFEVSRIKWFL